MIFLRMVWLSLLPGPKCCSLCARSFCVSPSSSQIREQAKSLDALAVILVGLPSFDQLTRPYDRFTYFMGASRAWQLLACVHAG